MKRHVVTRLKHRKNYTPTILIGLLLWATSALVIVAQKPDQLSAVLAFFVLVFSSLLFTFSLIFGNTKKGFTDSTYITLFLFVRAIGIKDTLPTIVLLIGFVLIQIYLLRKS